MLINEVTLTRFGHFLHSSTQLFHFLNYLCMLKCTFASVYVHIRIYFPLCSHHQIQLCCIATTYIHTVAKTVPGLVVRWTKTPYTFYSAKQTQFTLQQNERVLAV